MIKDCGKAAWGLLRQHVIRLADDLDRAPGIARAAAREAMANRARVRSPTAILVGTAIRARSLAASIAGGLPPPISSGITRAFARWMARRSGDAARTRSGLSSRTSSTAWAEWDQAATEMGRHKSGPPRLPLEKRDQLARVSLGAEGAAIVRPGFGAEPPQGRRQHAGLARQCTNDRTPERAFAGRAMHQHERIGG